LFVNRLKQSIKDICFIWMREVRQAFTDEGVILFCIVVPLFYPLLYSWIYNNEVLEETPVVVVDQCHTGTSREFVRYCDATPNIKVVGYAADMEEARKAMNMQGCKGIILIPSDFSKRINRMEQAMVGTYVNMSGMLYYKNVLQATTNASLEMGKKITLQKLGNYTTREDEVSAEPLKFEAVPLFNPSGGYGSFLLPAVLVLILQQTLMLGIGLSAGTSREKNQTAELIPFSHRYNSWFNIVLGKGLCYYMLYSILAAYVLVVVPKLFNFIQMISMHDLIAIMVPYLLACVFFGLMLSCLVRYRENVLLLVVFTSVPLLFLSGVSWPGSSIPGFWKGVSYLFPSTFGIRAFVRMNSMGATLGDVFYEVRGLWVQTVCYFFMACGVFRFQVYLAKKHADELKEEEPVS